MPYTINENAMGNSKSDQWTALIFGIAGGLLKFSNLIALSYLEALLKSGFTALICGFMGVVGKNLFAFSIKWWKQKFPKKIKPNE